jgi:Domain of unknown function (DUF4249)
MRKIFYFFILGISLFSCIDPFDPQIKQGGDKLIVDAFISSDPGPENRVILSWSEPFNEDTAALAHPSSAKVYLTDQAGQRTDFAEKSFGRFLPTLNSFAAKIGSTYTLHVELADGKKYISTPEKILKPMPIDTAYLELKEKTNDLGVAIQRTFDVIVETKDDPQAANYYRWDWRHYNLIPSCFVRIICRPICVRLVFPCCPNVSCWDIYHPRGRDAIFVASDNLVNGKKIKRKIGEIGYTTIEPFFIVLTQMSISEGAHRFWQSSAGQIRNTGGIFDATPSSIRSNLRNVNDPDEVVLGYFEAVGVTRRPFYLNRAFAFEKLNKIPMPQYDPYPTRMDEAPTESGPCYFCNESETRTNFQPIGWIQ